MDDAGERKQTRTVLVTLPPDIDEVVNTIAGERYCSRARVVLDRLVDSLRLEGRIGQADVEQPVEVVV